MDTSKQNEAIVDDLRIFIKKLELFVSAEEKAIELGIDDENMVKVVKARIKTKKHIIAELKKILER